MNVLVQHIHSKLYLAKSGSWVKRDASAATFPNAVEAIYFCIQQRTRFVRLVSKAGSNGQERYLYPFGEDPAVKAEKKKRRLRIAECRRLERARRELMAGLDMHRAERKTAKQRVSFPAQDDLRRQ